MHIDTSKLFSRGLDDFGNLRDQERLVFLVMLFETRMIMDGWDDFFTSGWARNYPELKQGLQAVGDFQSVELLEDYEKHIRSKGVDFEPVAIDSFLCEQEGEYFAACRDWQEEFSHLTDYRWNKITEYMRQKGITLV